LSESRSLTIRASRRRFGVLCVLGYVALSWVVRSDLRLGQQIASLVYPLDTFSMYGGMPGADRSHLLVRDGQGIVHRVTDYRTFDCAEPLTGDAARCGGKHGIPYLYEDLTRYIESHAGPGGSEIDVITRTWEFESGTSPVRTSDCVIARCRVTR
jgi:hypothetical protein